MTVKTRNVPPRANSMLESLRGLGYSPGGALADIIDNSISAGAAEVRLDFVWAASKSHISVLDDGRGMDDQELESALTLGDKNPLDVRAAHDLGRFGMGLKTSSFSQCKRLTVASKKDGAVSCLRWDLEILAANPESGWLLFEGPAEGSQIILDSLTAKPKGTLVVWEVLDRIVTDGFTADDFIELSFHIEAHLAMVFHRLLQGPHARLRILINGKAVVPWDPFMTGHPAKSWTSPVARHTTSYGVVEVQCHVLPHRDKLKPDEVASAGGPEGWTAQQGFYVYRNERLLVAGGWLGLGNARAWNKEEPHRLARIRLDIPNSADADWKIDVKKSTARPPVTLRPWLTRLAENTRERARQVFAHRGTPTPAPNGTAVDQAWVVDRIASGMRYRIADTHPSVRAVLDSAGPNAPLVKAMLRVIEETVPVQRIWLDTAEHKETPRTGFAGEAPEAVMAVLRTLFQDMIGRKGMSVEAAKRALLSTEPFQNFPAQIDTLKAAP